MKFSVKINSIALKHSILFNIVWSMILFAEVLNLPYKVFILVALPLIFLILHLHYFTKNFVPEVIFIASSFVMGLSAEVTLSNLEIYHFGIIDLPDLNWPPPWTAALWMIFPVYLCTSLQVLNKLRILGAYLGALLSFITYYFVGERLDLIFFNPPLQQNAMVFILAWYLIIRGLFWLHRKITLQ